MSWLAACSLAREVTTRRAGDVDIRVWVPSCGDGRPAYELVAALSELLGVDETLARVHVCATDPSHTNVREARAGVATADWLEHVPADVADRYFPTGGDDRGFTESLRGAISFARNDLVRDRPLRRVDLIDGRQLDDAGLERLPLLAQCLRPGGLLAAPALPSGADVDLVPVAGMNGLWERPIPVGAANFGAAWRPTAPLRIVVVNEHELFVRGLGVLLESMFGRFVTVVAVSHDPEHALELIDRERPDLVIVDVTGPTSRDLPAKIQRHPFHVPVLALTEDPHEAWREMIAGGAAGVVPRSVSASELVGSLLAVAEGLAVLPPEAVRMLSRGVPSEQLGLLDQLDAEDLRLWAWVAQGLQDNEIADLLHVSARTVKRRVGSLLRELGVGRRVEAAELAGRLGLVTRMEARGELAAAVGAVVKA